MHFRRRRPLAAVAFALVPLAFSTASAASTTVVEPGDAETILVEFGGGGGLREVTIAAGSAWVVSPDDDLVLRFDPAGELVAQVAVDSAWAIGTAADVPWVGSSGAAAGIDPSTNAIGWSIEPAGLGAVAVDGIAGDATSLWVATNAGALLELDVVAGTVVREISIVGEFPKPAVGTDTVWVAPGEFGNEELQLVDRATGEVTALVVGPSLSSVTADSTSAWVVSDDTTVCTVGSAAAAGCVGVGVDPVYEEIASISYGAGFVWAAVEGSDDSDFPSRPRLLQLDPATLEVVSEVDVTGATSFFDIVAGPDAVWATGAVEDSNAVFRVPLGA